MKSFLKKLNEQLNEATQSTWDFPDIVPVKAPGQSQQGQPGQPGQETKVIGKKETEKPKDQPTQPGQQGQKGQQGQGGSGGQKGEEDSGQVQSGKGGSKKTTTGQMDKGEGRGNPGEKSDINNNKEWMDDHSKIEKGDATAKSIVNEVYKEVENEYRKREARNPGSGAGNLMTKVKEMLKEEFDVGRILARIGTFKKKLSERIQKRETYQAAIYNPVTQQTSILGKGSPKLKEKTKNSAIMFFAADTSGSITSEDYKSIFGYINDIATRFKKQQHGIDGDVYLIEWDARVHTPIRKWEAINKIKPKKDMSEEERKALSLRGGGGTNIQALFDFLDNQFVKNIDGQDYFVFGDNMPVLTGKEPDSDNAKPKSAIARKLKAGDENYNAPSFKEDEIQSARPSEINIKEGGYDNIPFLIIYTDGYFNPPNISSSKLYSANPGNILYIVTDKNGIKNVRPKNYIYHDLRSNEQQ